MTLLLLLTTSIMKKSCFPDGNTSHYFPIRPCVEGQGEIFQCIFPTWRKWQSPKLSVWIFDWRCNDLTHPNFPNSCPSIPIPQSPQKGLYALASRDTSTVSQPFKEQKESEEMVWSPHLPNPFHFYRGFQCLPIIHNRWNIRLSFPVDYSIRL